MNQKIKEDLFVGAVMLPSESQYSLSSPFIFICKYLFAVIISLIWSSDLCYPRLLLGFLLDNLCCPVLWGSCSFGSLGSSPLLLEWMRWVLGKPNSWPWSWVWMVARQSTSFFFPSHHPGELLTTFTAIPS